MRTRLDESLASLVSVSPGWESVLDPGDVALVKGRLAGLTLRELAGAYGYTVPGVRVRLYGVGSGGLRSGGVLGRLRSRHRQQNERVE